MFKISFSFDFHYFQMTFFSIHTLLNLFPFISTNYYVLLAFYVTGQHKVVPQREVKGKYLSVHLFGYVSTSFPHLDTKISAKFSQI